MARSSDVGGRFRKIDGGHGVLCAVLRPRKNGKARRALVFSCDEVSELTEYIRRHNISSNPDHGRDSYWHNLANGQCDTKRTWVFVPADAPPGPKARLGYPKYKPQPIAQCLGKRPDGNRCEKTRDGKCC